MTEKMKKILSRLAAISVSCSMLLSMVVPSFGESIKPALDITKQLKQIEKEEAPLKLDSTASSWAVPELTEAYEAGLTYPGVMNNFRKPITREEFCTIVVKLYEKLTGELITAGTNPFSDTDNPEIIKANQLKIVYGTGQGKFSPNLNITRQEISVMIYRALVNALNDIDLSEDEDFPFADESQIANWAFSAMKFCYKNSILNGVGNNRIAPLDNTTREQAIVIVKRAYASFSADMGADKSGDSAIKKPGVIKNQDSLSDALGIDLKLLPDGIKLHTEVNINGMVIRPDIPSGVISGGTGQSGSGSGVQKTEATLVVNQGIQMMSEKEKALSYKRENRLAYPVYKTNLSLMAALGEDKSSGYTSADGASLIDQDGSKKRWFKFNLADSRNVKKVVWQVSRRPFTGFGDNWKNPVGLVKSGEVALASGATSGEFLIDFAAFNQAQNASDKIRIGSNGVLSWGGDGIFREIPASQKVYYVRAVPVNSTGDCVGDPGTGVAVIYGKPMTAPSLRELTVNPSFELWPANFQGMPDLSGEFPNLFLQTDKASVNCDELDLTHWFQIKGHDAAALKVIIQVSTKPFSNKLANWETPEGLVYSKTYDKLPIMENITFPDSMPVDFGLFAPKRSDMKPGDSIKYYVRAVAVSPYSGTGSVGVSFSGTTSLNYFRQNTKKIYKQETKYVKSYIPDIKVLSYVPRKHEHPDWPQYYQVFRKPKWDEIDFRVINSRTGFILFPYEYYEDDVSKAEYENNIIPLAINVGDMIRISPAEGNKKWYEEIWDAITEFFESLVSIVMKVVNWASSAYNGLKAGFINLVASALPVPGLKLALEVMVNAGLMALGLPPTIPNFEQLCEQGIDYLAEVALTEAGVPANTVTKELLKETADLIGDQVKEAYNKEAPNPVDAPFLKNHPDVLEQPAYIEVELSNPYDKPSLPGCFNIDAEWPYRDEISVSADMGIAPQDQLAYIKHIVEGLKRGVGYTPGYPVFKPVRGQKIPSLKPGEKLMVKIYLEPYYGKPYPFAPMGDVVTEQDYINFYYGHFGKLNFSVYTDYYDLPDPELVAKAQNFAESPDTIYSYRYDKYWSSVKFTSNGNEMWVP